MTSIEYIQCDFSKCFVDFRVHSLYMNEPVNELIRINAKSMYELKLTKTPIKSSVEFLRTVKYIKDNLDNRKIQGVLVNLAIKQHKVHEEEMEELKLMLELGKPSGHMKTHAT